MFRSRSTSSPGRTTPRCICSRARCLASGLCWHTPVPRRRVSTGCSALDWRLAFAFPAAVALVLALLPPTMTAHDRPTGPPSIGALANRNLATACGLSFLCYLGAVGLTVLSVLRAEEEFGLGPWQRELLAA